MYDHALWRVHALEVFLEISMNPSIQDHMRSTTLMYIVDSWTTEVLSRAANQHASSLVAEVASDMILQLLDCMKQKNKDLIMPLFDDPRGLCLAIMSKKEELAWEILKYSTSVDTIAHQLNQISPLQTACFYGSNSQLLRELIERSRVDRAVPGTSANLFRIACKGVKPNLMSTIMCLLESGFNANDRNHHGQHALMFAARCGNAVVVESLMEHGCELSVLDDNGWSAIYYACVSGSEESLHSLKSVVKDWHAKIAFKVGPLQIEDATAIHLAASLDNGILTYLLQQELVTDIECLTLHKQSPLFIASLSGVSRNVSLLLDRQANDVHLETQHGFSALHIAAFQGRSEIVKLFIRSGCNLRSKHRSGLIPELLARKHGHLNLADLLNKETSSKSEEGPHVCYTLISAQEFKITPLQPLQTYVPSQNL